MGVLFTRFQHLVAIAGWLPVYRVSVSYTHSVAGIIYGRYIQLMAGTQSCYWAVQAGLLTSLTFARHRLSPLAAFTSGAYFLHNERW